MPWQWLQAATASPTAGRSGGGAAQRRGVVRGEREQGRQFQTSQERRDRRARGKIEKLAGNFESDLGQERGTDRESGSFYLLFSGVEVKGQRSKFKGQRSNGTAGGVMRGPIISGSARHGSTRGVDFFRPSVRGKKWRRKKEVKGQRSKVKRRDARQNWRQKVRRKTSDNDVRQRSKVKVKAPPRGRGGRTPR